MGYHSVSPLLMPKQLPKQLPGVQLAVRADAQAAAIVVACIGARAGQEHGQLTDGVVALRHAHGNRPRGPRQRQLRAALSNGRYHPS